MPKPTIAAIDGHVIGDGIAPALACDLRLASSRKTFRLPEARYGFIPGWGTLHRLARAIGRHRALDMFLTGRTVDADTALEWGLVSRLHLAETFAEGLNALVEGLLAMSPTALSLAKMALMDGSGSPDGTPSKETAAFLAKHSPEFGPPRPFRLDRYR
jgi:enoyl-CoA hydratase/carnithine racemase